MIISNVKLMGRAPSLDGGSSSCAAWLASSSSPPRADASARPDQPLTCCACFFAQPDLCLWNSTGCAIFRLLRFGLRGLAARLCPAWFQSPSPGDYLSFLSPLQSRLPARIRLIHVNLSVITMIFCKPWLLPPEPCPILL
jgi:hypothetical protein